MERRPGDYDGYIFDLDGTIYLGDQLLPTAKETIIKLRKQGKKTAFLSNNPTQNRATYAAKLTRLGLPTYPDEVINSSLVMVTYLKKYVPSARLFVIGEQPLLDELGNAGFQLSEDTENIDFVIASFDRTFTYHKLQVAFDAINKGARFCATNADRYCPVPGGGEPDAAAIIAAVEACTNTQVEFVVGKPSNYMAETVLDLIALPPSRCLVTGDRLETDVALGVNAGMDAALVLTGATREEDIRNSTIVPTFVLKNLSDLVTHQN